MPSLRGDWHYDARAHQVQVAIAQVQPGEPYRLPLEIAVVSPRGESRTERVELSQSSGRFTFAADAEPASVTLDPNVWVLLQKVEFLKR